MRRIVVTGLGIVSSIGNNQDEVAASLRSGRSGIVFAKHGLLKPLHLHGIIA